MCFASLSCSNLSLLYCFIDGKLFISRRIYFMSFAASVSVITFDVFWYGDSLHAAAHVCSSFILLLFYACSLYYNSFCTTRRDYNHFHVRWHIASHLVSNLSHQLKCAVLERTDCKQCVAVGHVFNCYDFFL